MPEFSCAQSGDGDIRRHADFAVGVKRIMAPLIGGEFLLHQTAIILPP